MKRWKIAKKWKALRSFSGNLEGLLEVFLVSCRTRQQLWASEEKESTTGCFQKAQRMTETTLG